MAGTETRLFSKGSSDSLKGRSYSLLDLCQPWETYEWLRIGQTSVSYGPSYDEMVKLEGELALPQSFWSKGPGHHRMSGFFGAQSPVHPVEEPDLHTTESRFLWKRSLLTKGPRDQGVQWLSLSIFTRWKSDGKTIVVLECQDANLAEELVGGIAADLSEEACRTDPYAVHAAVLKQILRIYTNNVHSWQGFVRSFESRRQYDISAEQLYSLDDMPRHLIHCTECLEVAVGVIDSMIEEHLDFLQDRQSPDYERPAEARRVSQSLRKYRSLFRALLLQAKSLESRIAHEAELVGTSDPSFRRHKLTRRKDRTYMARKDSHTATNIASLAQADSSSTKTISILGLVFLPTTLVCVSRPFLDDMGSKQLTTGDSLSSAQPSSLSNQPLK
ncbi:Hypothetical protein D9617_8g050880 [Elsinoe fawcettii]|nr:Hypothetical protein D9617_8g050880 [Elsinoe fawcettii]